MKHLALCTPSGNAYSETFIQAHKNIPDHKVFFYFNGQVSTWLEQKGPLYTTSFFKKWKFKLLKKTFYKNFSIQEIVLIQSFQKNKIQVVLAEYGPTAVALLKVCKKLKLPLVVHFHGFDASVKNVLDANQTNYLEVFHYAQSVVVVSKVMYAKLLDLGCPKEKLALNIYGPNEQFFDVKPTFSGDYFISVGRFVDKKAPYYLILAMEKVVKKHQEVKLYMGGNGPLFNVCKNMIRFYQLEKNILLLDIIKPEEYRKYLENALAYVPHSLTADNGDIEGTPLAVLEASAAGLPVISTLHAGISEVIIHEKTGFLVEEHDVTAMAHYMIQIIENKKLAQELGSKGKQNIKAHFSMNKHLGNLAQLLSK